MEGENKKSNALKIIFWIATLGCFIFGYYNTHLGLRTFNAFGSGNGSWFLAAIPLVMVFGGYVASVQGRKKMLALYLTGEVLFFVFNLTYLYPTYLGRTLVNEEAKTIKSTLNTYQGKVDAIIINKANESGTDLRQLTQSINDLRDARDMLLREIGERNGFGPEATKQLENINKIAGSHLTPDRDLGTTPEKIKEKLDYWEKTVNNVITTYRKSMIGDQQIADKLFDIQENIDVLSTEYNAKLDIILDDHSDVNIEHSEIANNLQIAVIQQLATKLDKMADNVNSIVPNSFDKKELSAFPTIQELGTFQHTLISVGKRIGKLDTWGVIIICFFFDLLGPFLFYFYLRKDDSDGYGTDEGAFDKPWWKRIFGLD